MAQTDNAITRRADQLQQMWRTFLKNPTAKCCYWVLEPDATRMIDVFHEMNSRDSHKTPDLFIRFKIPFEDISTYGSTLSEFLAGVVALERADFLTAGVPLEWQSKHEDAPSNRALGFLRNFFNLAAALKLGEGVLVAYLAPEEILRVEEWERWCFDATRLPIPDKMRLMFVETEGQQNLSKLAKQHPERIATLQPKLDMTNAIRELMAETGDQNDKGSHFQKAFFELTQSVAQKDMNRMKVHAEKAIQLSRSMGYPHLEIGVLCATANAFMANEQPKVAIAAYDEALRVAQAAHGKPLVPQMPDVKVDESNGSVFDQLAMQVLFSKGSALITLRIPKYEEAMTVYQQADSLLKNIISKNPKFPKDNVDFEHGAILLMHRMEALRMTGFCLEALKQGQKALEIYETAVLLAEKLPFEIRQNTTLAFIGRAMMNLCHGFAMKREFHAVVNRMIVLLGEGWDKKLPKK